MADGERVPESEAPTVVQELAVRVAESPDYRTIHVNGSMGSYNQFGEIFIALYSERAENPKRSIMRLLSDGATQVENVSTPDDTGVVRELQVGMFMSPSAAQNLLNMLVTTLTNLKKALEDAQGDSAVAQPSDTTHE